MQLTFKTILTTIRFHHYVKNLFIFLPLFFGSQLLNFPLLSKTTLAFVAFSFTASAIYILNDFKDIDVDKHHPYKKYRPIPLGIISIEHAQFLMTIFLLVGLGLMLSLSISAFIVLICYIILNIGYSFYFKHIFIIDITIIAIGFVLRIIVGSFVSTISLSTWIILMTFLLAFFIALSKRRDDLLFFLKTKSKIRKVIDRYDLKIIDKSLMLMAFVIIFIYVLYTIAANETLAANNNYIFLTILFVIIGFFRYFQIVFTDHHSGSPTTIFYRDKILKLTILIWVLFYTWIIYL